MPVFLGGDKWVRVDEALAEAFQPGDSLAVAPKTGELLHIPANEQQIATSAVSQALDAFGKMGAVGDDQISQFFGAFADALADDAIWTQIQKINEDDVAAAKARGRSTTRLEATEKLRDGMIEGLRGWIEAPSRKPSC